MDMPCECPMTGEQVVREPWSTPVPLHLLFSLASAHMSPPPFFPLLSSPSVFPVGSVSVPFLYFTLLILM